MAARNLPCDKPGASGVPGAVRATRFQCPSLGHYVARGWGQRWRAAGQGERALSQHFLSELGETGTPLAFWAKSNHSPFDSVPPSAPPGVEPASVSGVRDQMALPQLAVAALTWLPNPAAPAWTSL